MFHSLRMLKRISRDLDFILIATQFSGRFPSVLNDNFKFGNYRLVYS